MCRPSPLLWVLCPTLNDVDSFVVVRDSTREAVRASGLVARFELRFVVVDDSAGVDPETARLQRFEDVTVLVPPYNLGHQRAIVFGLRWLRARVNPADVLVTMDSDGEDQPADVPRLVAALTDGGRADFTAVLARRTSRKESFGFKVLYFNFKLLFRLLTGTLISSGNFVCFGSSFLQLIDHPYFNLCYSSTFKSLRIPLVEVPCARGSRIRGRSRMDTSSLIAHGFSMLMPFVDVISTRLLILFSLVFGSSVGVALLFLGAHLFTSFEVPGWALFALLTLLAISFMSISNFVILFSLFSQTKGLLMDARGPVRHWEHQREREAG